MLYKPYNHVQVVNIAKDINNDDMPKMMYNNGVMINQENHQEEFADFFETKIRSLVTNTHIDPGVYNGINKLHSQEKNFMTEDNIMKAVKSI